MMVYSFGVSRVLFPVRMILCYVSYLLSIMEWSWQKIWVM